MSKETKYKIIKFSKRIEIRNDNEFICCNPFIHQTKESAELKAAFVLSILNNHDRLVEALERSNKELQKITRLAWDNDYLQTDLDKSLNQTREVNRLLTELKQQ